MLDRVVEDRVHNNRDGFIESIKEDDICRLASSYHNSEPCTIFKPPVRGSYNICFFVRFCSLSSDNETISDGEKCEEGDSWVVRVPLSPCLSFEAHEKLESEVATMQLIAEKTNIPIPRIHVYSLAQEKGPYNIASFVILDYIEGRTLFDVRFKTLLDDQRRHLYEQLASIYIHLRRLEFSSIGILSRGSDGFDVRKKPMSISINEQELEGLQSSRIQAEYGSCKGVLTSASDYVSMLLRIAWNAFEKGRKSFSQFAEKKWLNPKLDSGPFVLVHGDLNPYNLIVNENMDIVALLDWEWSRVVPLQFFMPPTWLTSLETDDLAWPFRYSRYVNELDKFRTVVRDQELKTYGEGLLSNDWAGVHENGGILIAAALENWTDIDYFAGRYLDKFLYQRKGLEDRIGEFMKQDPARRTLVTRKIRDWAAYRAERKRLGVEDPADDEIEIVEMAPLTRCPWDHFTSITPRLFTWWLGEKAGLSPRVDQILSKVAMGGGTIVLLAGISYIIWNRIAKYPFSL
ncbi:Uncharacterized protein BP5553_00339 [Venustampulla echinocandica]|uniref:Aminoglycoside phosphotransferase domain-containing protein n=1 Tax=Venustampulla echinocandica TaxID=2656787 RepID=A0A370TXX3_9HELO|nr:Uncharacterized protein BP5553_00339 [Venustampulla echinocandica]RDL40360.1 Uncharacterized protein BP5553_00339 [Venustampulla echinocandica]